MTQRVFDAILQTINKIMTSARLQRLRKDVQSTVNVWFHEQQRRNDCHDPMGQPLTQMSASLIDPPQ
jgi:hypothetical protein